MFDFSKSFTWWKRREQLHPSVFGLFHIAHDTINKNEDRWHYINYVWTSNRDNSDIFWHFYDEVSNYHFFLRNKAFPKFNQNKYSLYWSKDHTLNSEDAIQHETGWETMEEFSNYFDGFLETFRTENKNED